MGETEAADDDVFEDGGVGCAGGAGEGSTIEVTGRAGDNGWGELEAEGVDGKQEPGGEDGAGFEGVQGAKTGVAARERLEWVGTIGDKSFGEGGKTGLDGGAAYSAGAEKPGVAGEAIEKAQVGVDDEGGGETEVAALGAELAEEKDESGGVIFDKDLFAEWERAKRGVCLEQLADLVESGWVII